jgi:hypothetical protein
MGRDVNEPMPEAVAKKNGSGDAETAQKAAIAEAEVATA